MSYKIYLVEDEENLNELLSSYLSKEGWQVQPFLSGERPAGHTSDPTYELDIMLPDIDGYRLLQYIKPMIRPYRSSIYRLGMQNQSGSGFGNGQRRYLPKPFLPRAGDQNPQIVGAGI